MQNKDAIKNVRKLPNLMMNLNIIYFMFNQFLSAILSTLMYKHIIRDLIKTIQIPNQNEISVFRQ